MKFTLNLNSNSKNEVFSLNKSRENEGQSWYLRAVFLQIFIIRGLKSDAILSVVDRNVAICTTRHAITPYEFQVRQGKLWQNSLTFCFPKLSTIVLIFLNHFYGCKKPSHIRYMILVTRKSLYENESFFSCFQANVFLKETAFHTLKFRKAQVYRSIAYRSK